MTLFPSEVEEQSINPDPSARMFVLTQMIEDGSYAKLCEKWFGTNVMESKYAKEYREKQGK